MARDPNAYKTDVWVDWCPGCGDYGILTGLTRALSKLDLDPRKTVLVSGIGCSGKTPHFINVNGVHTLHGRAIPFATGIKIANPELTVVVSAGDGDLLGIGAGHFVAVGRRNVDITIIMHNNGVYGLTKGQAAPTLAREIKTKSLSKSNIQDAVNPIALALTSGFTFVARAYAMDPNHLSTIVERAIKHKGTAFIDVLQPCVTYNNIHTIHYYKNKIYKLEEQENWNPHVDNPDEREVEEKLINAMIKAFEWGNKIPIGIFYENPHVPTYEERISNRIPLYISYPPGKQEIRGENKAPIIDPRVFRDMFKEKIIKTKV